MRSKRIRRKGRENMVAVWWWLCVCERLSASVSVIAPRMYARVCVCMQIIVPLRDLQNEIVENTERIQMMLRLHAAAAVVLCCVDNVLMMMIVFYFCVV